MNRIIQNNNVIEVVNGKTIINGIELPSIPGKNGVANVSMINNKIYINGYELINGEWKRTLKALWYFLF